MPFEHICIEGNIGIGKTSLVKKLAAHTGAYAFYEEFEENPLLPQFYHDPKSVALNLELSFLHARAKQLQKIKQEHPGKMLLSDYWLDKCLLFAQTNLPPTDFEKYKNLHGDLAATVGIPSLVIVLHSEVSHLQKNIKTRNRSYEQNMEDTYLDKLNKAYRNFFSTEKKYTVFNIFTDQLDENAYSRVEGEIKAFLKLEPKTKITNIEL